MTFIITPEMFEEQRRRCELLGLDALTYEQARDEGSAARRVRTSCHEIGHVGAHLHGDVEFASVDVHPGGGGAVRCFDPLRPPVARDGIPPLEARVAVQCGGLCAEAVLLGRVDPWGARVDTVRALALAAGDAHIIPEQVAELRQSFARHRDMLARLARALRRAASLSRADCVRLARAAGCLVPKRARYEPRSPPEELARMRAAREGQRRQERKEHADCNA
ncbi:MAG: hypothetical protein ACRELB_04355 [Polyangiaceae bacterium]